MGASRKSQHMLRRNGPRRKALPDLHDVYVVALLVVFEHGQ